MIKATPTPAYEGTMKIAVRRHQDIKIEGGIAAASARRERESERARERERERHTHTHHLADGAMGLVFRAYGLGFRVSCFVFRV